MSQLKPSTPAKEYDSNPFTLSFNALGRFFHSNMGWAVVIIVLGIFGFILNMGSNLAQFVASDPNAASSSNISSNTGTSPDVAVIAAIVIFVVVIALFAITIWSVLYVFIKGMFSYVALKSEEGEPVDFKQAFDAVSKRFWRLLWSSLLADLKIFGWTLLFIVPGIIASLRYSMLSYVIMSEPESEKGVKDSHDKTKLLVRSRLIEVFGVSTVGALVPVVGSLLDLSGKAALFNQLNYFNSHNLEKPKIHWLNYLGFILLGILLLFVMAILGIVFVVAAAN